MGVPIPQRKPDVSTLSNDNNSILGSIWNSAVGVFENVAAIELERYETKRLEELRALESDAKVKRDETLAGKTVQVISYADDPQVQKIALIAGIGLITFATVLLLKG